jgi:hypothetical protein
MSKIFSETERTIWPMKRPIRQAVVILVLDGFAAIGFTEYAYSAGSRELREFPQKTTVTLV